jgi:hypothetical protein
VVFEFKILNGEEIRLKKLNIIGQIPIRVYKNIVTHNINVYTIEIIFKWFLNLRF